MNRNNWIIAGLLLISAVYYVGFYTTSSATDEVVINIEQPAIEQKSEDAAIPADELLRQVQGDPSEALAVEQAEEEPAPADSGAANGGKSDGKSGTASANGKTGSASANGSSSAKSSSSGR